MSAAAVLPWLWRAPLIAAALAIVAPGRLAWGVGVAVAGALTITCLFGHVFLAAGPAGPPSEEVAAVLLRDALQPLLSDSPLAAPGVLLTALCACVAMALTRPGDGGARVGGALALTGAVMAAWLAGDVVTLACALTGAPLLVALGLAGTSADDRARAARRAFVGLSLASCALLVVSAYGVVESYNATRGQWSLALSSLDALVLPAAAEPLALVGIVLASWMLLGAWPLHGWLSDLVRCAPPALAVIVLGPYRWLGLWMLITLGPALAGSTWFPAAPWLAALAVVGALIGAFAALAAVSSEDADEVRLARTVLARGAVVPVGFALVGVLGASVEGLLGACLLVLGHGLVAAALFLVICGRDRSRPWLGTVALVGAGAPLLGVYAGVVLVLYGTARFVLPVLPGAPVIAAALVVVAAVYALGLARLAGRLQRPVSTDPTSRSFGLASVVTLLSLIVLTALGVWPQRWLAPANAAARARVDVLYRARCVALERGAAERARVLKARPAGCEAAVRRVIERATRAAGGDA